MEEAGLSQATSRPRPSPSPARPLGPETFQFFLPCVWAQFPSSRREVSGTAIRGKPAITKGVVESQQVLSLQPDNELASFSNHLSLSVNTVPCSHRRGDEHGSDVCLRREGSLLGQTLQCWIGHRCGGRGGKTRQVRGSCPDL